VASVIESLQFIAMKAILAVRCDVEGKACRSDKKQSAHVRAEKLNSSVPHRLLYFPQALVNELKQGISIA
jgi:hypothetical protein